MKKMLIIITLKLIFAFSIFTTISQPTSAYGFISICSTPIKTKPKKDTEKVIHEQVEKIVRFFVSKGNYNGSKSFKRSKAKKLLKKVQKTFNNTFDYEKTLNLAAEILRQEYPWTPKESWIFLFESLTPASSNFSNAQFEIANFLFQSDQFRTLESDSPQAIFAKRKEKCQLTLEAIHKAPTPKNADFTNMISSWCKINLNSIEEKAPVPLEWGFPIYPNTTTLLYLLDLLGKKEIEIDHLKKQLR